MFDFKEIIDRIFINKKLYHEISDDGKINNFFIINRKLGKQYPEISKKFNHKYIDKASAIDMWFEYFKNSSFYKLPGWYWDPKNRIKPTKANKKSNYDAIKQREDLDDFDMKFLEKFYEEDLKNEMKKLNKFEQ
jgi:hypothetical protein